MKDDGYHLPEIGLHSLDKIQRHNYYASLFATAMAPKWKHLVYIGLYAGAGKAQVKQTGDIVETSALAALKQETQFSKYIFVDSDPDCIRALESRIRDIDSERDVELICRPVDAAVSDIVQGLPHFDASTGEGMLCFCFVDPFRLDLDFAVIRRLSRFKVDFLVMLPFGFDLRRNLRLYLEDESDQRVARLIDDADWRSDWRSRNRSDRHFVPFIMERFQAAMAGLSYHGELRDMHSVKVAGMGVYLYSLAFFSRHPLGDKFWKTTLAETDPQIGLEI